MLIFSLAPLLEIGIVSAGPPPEFNGLNFGAVGDGVADDKRSFSKAWAVTCGVSTCPPIVPKDKTFLVMPMTFKGPCKFQKVFVQDNFAVALILSLGYLILVVGSTKEFNVAHFGAVGDGTTDDTQIEGTIVAPDSPSTWNGIDPNEWLQFKSVSGLTVEGPGEINGRGYNWWKQSCRDNPTQGCTTAAPTALKFIGCNNLQVSHLTSVNSAQAHLVILSCQWVGVDNITIMAPENSPNTDGIHIHASHHVKVEDSSIGTGDDCISIGDYVSDIGIKNIFCGPGHGISVGSLGRGGSEASVEGIHVEYVNFQNTTNGARIKTWQGAKGFARGISFKHCIFNNVQNPIVIDQYYCDVANKCKSKSTDVQVSNVTYTDFQGTSKTPLAVSMNCSQAIPCTAIQFDNVNLTLAATEADTEAYCINAYGYTKGFVHPNIDCLRG